MQLPIKEGYITIVCANRLLFEALLNFFDNFSAISFKIYGINSAKWSDRHLQKRESCCLSLRKSSLLVFLKEQPLYQRSFLACSTFQSTRLYLCLIICLTRFESSGSNAYDIFFFIYSNFFRRTPAQRELSAQGGVDSWGISICQLTDRFILCIINGFDNRKLIMEKIDQRLAFIGVDCGQRLSSVRPKPQDCESSKRKEIGKAEDPRKKKLYRQYQQLMKKMETQQRIEEREQKANKRLQQIQNKRNQSKANKYQTWNKIQHGLSEDQNLSPVDQIKADKKASLPKKDQKYMSSTAKQNAFKVYHNKGRIPSGLPTLCRPKQKNWKQQTSPKANQSLDLIDFGIFSEHKSSQPFLRKLRSTLEKEFLCGVDLNCDEDLLKLQHLLLKEIRNENR